MLRAALALALVLVGLAVIPRFTDRPVDDCEVGVDVVEWNGGMYISEEVDPPRPPDGGPLAGGTRPDGCGEDIPTPLLSVEGLPPEIAVYREGTVAGIHVNQDYRLLERGGRVTYRRRP